MSFLNLGLAFLEGLALIISPCILPILPIVLSSGIDGGRRRPYGLIVGFVLTFSVFTLLSRKLVQVSGLDPELFRVVSFYVLILFGLVLIIEPLSDFFASLTQHLSDLGQGVINRHQKGSGFSSGLLVGSAIGLVWTPCAGPILTAVIVQTIRAETDWAGVLMVFAFGLGAAIPMLILTLQGKKWMNRLNFVKQHTGFMRKAFGAVIIATVLVTAQGSLFHWNFSLAGPHTAGKPMPTLKNGLDRPYQAPEFSGLTGWTNTAPLTMKSLRGKVVLIDFWTYSCINCVRTLPYLKNWDQQYRDQGLVIVGVHAPEFEFEKKLDNVRKAVAEHGLKYPVALDNNLDTWTAFRNQYWPAHYLIDREGRVVYTHFGEGEYATTEGNIRVLLGRGKTTAHVPSMREKTPSFSFNQTPETYLGYARAAHYAGTPTPESDQITTFAFPGKLPMHHWALRGKWFTDSEKLIAQEPGAALRFRFSSKNVYLVMGVPPKKSVAVKVLLNGQPVKTISVNRQTLYTLVNQSNEKTGTVELQAQGPGLAAYAFTFGE